MYVFFKLKLKRKPSDNNVKYFFMKCEMNKVDFQERFLFPFAIFQDSNQFYFIRALTFTSFTPSFTRSFAFTKSSFDAYKSFIPESLTFSFAYVNRNIVTKFRWFLSQHLKHISP